MVRHFMSAAPFVSVVVPVRGDPGPLGALLAQLPARAGVQVVVASTGAIAAAQARLRLARPDVQWVDAPPGRGVQLNAGAAVAQGAWLWFVHADSQLPERWWEAFIRLDGSAAVGGSFAFRLDSAAWQARWLERAVAFRVRLFDLPYGVQGIFVRRSVFSALRGFKPVPLMEDVEFMRRLKRHGRLAHLTVALVTSARRWEQRGWLRQSAANLVTLALYGLGVSPERLARRYDRGSSSTRGSSHVDQAGV
jgi:rSAM/selenodomain-associated transferase 2